ncbi:MAG: CDP-alcohol phosphatidyltransferase family protein [Flammeovirgaceae bacterium]
MPSYCFYFLAIAVWTYSTLDAIDGKQARRTKSSSPLGQLFDHGCDSFSTTFFVLALAQAFKLNSS